MNNVFYNFYGLMHVYKSLSDEGMTIKVLLNCMFYCIFGNQWFLVSAMYDCIFYCISNFYSFLYHICEELIEFSRKKHLLIILVLLWNTCCCVSKKMFCNPFCCKTKMCMWNSRSTLSQQLRRRQYNNYSLHIALHSNQI